MLAASRFGKINTFAVPRSRENGYVLFKIRSTTAVSACISPSACRPGSRSCSRLTACCTFSAAGWRTEPKFENDSNATRGSIPSRPTNSAVAERSEEHTSELQSHSDLVCRLLLEKKKKKQRHMTTLCAARGACKAM